MHNEELLKFARMMEALSYYERVNMRPQREAVLMGASEIMTEYALTASAIVEEALGAARDEKELFDDGGPPGLLRLYLLGGKEALL